MEAIQLERESLDCIAACADRYVATWQDNSGLDGDSYCAVARVFAEPGPHADQFPAGHVEHGAGVERVSLAHAPPAREQHAFHAEGAQPEQIRMR